MSCDVISCIRVVFLYACVYFCHCIVYVLVRLYASLSAFSRVYFCVSIYAFLMYVCACECVFVSVCAYQ